jgi:hypothetical protein
MAFPALGVYSYAKFECLDGVRFEDKLNGFEVLITPNLFGIITGKKAVSKKPPITIRISVAG